VGLPGDAGRSEGATTNYPEIGSFPNGRSLSVEFTEEALEERQARRGAWLEMEANDPSALKKRILDDGLPAVKYLGNDHFYFAAPRGQVLRIVPAR